jgi:aryl-alcohol dehydrogenase-like predicted oxidoreductase
MMMMKYRNLGRQGLVSSAIGLGCMGMSDFYAAAAGSEDESIATIRRALDLGITLLDTGDFYGMGHNEMLIREAIRGRRQQAVLSVKFGALRDHKGTFLGFDGRPAYVKTSLAYTLQRLGVDYVDFYFPSRIDTGVPIEDTVGAMSDLVREGKLRYIGLSEAGAATIRRAHAVHPLTAVETEYSLWSRDVEDDILPVLRELGIGMLAYGALSRGLFGGDIASSAQLSPRDFRHQIPRFQGAHFASNLKLMETFRGLAKEKGVTPSQLAIAWVLARGRDIVPLIGTRNLKHLDENLQAAGMQLSEVDLRKIEAAIPRGAVAGERYPVAHMPMLGR